MSYSFWKISFWYILFLCCRISTTRHNTIKMHGEAEARILGLVVSRHHSTLHRQEGGMVHTLVTNDNDEAVRLVAITSPGFLDCGGGLKRGGDAGLLVGMVAQARTGHTLGLLLSILCCTTRSNCLQHICNAGGVEVLATLVGALSTTKAGAAADIRASLVASLASEERVQLLLWLLDTLLRLPVTVDTLRRAQAGKIIAKLSRVNGAFGTEATRVIARRATAIKAKWLRTVQASTGAVCEKS